MSVYSSRALGRSLGAFSAFAGGGRVAWGPFSFSESWTSDDFDSVQQFRDWVKPFLDQVNRKDLTWEPPSSALKTRANTNFKVWKDAADMGSGSAGAYVQSITSQMTDLISRADALSLTGSLGKRSIGNEVARYDIFNEIAAIIKKVAGSAAQAAAAQTAAVAVADATLPFTPPSSQQPAGVRGDTTSGGIGVGRGALTSVGPEVAGGLTMGLSNTALYIGLGVAGLAVVGGLLYMRSKKRSSVAGYRRRSRR